ncbi:MAG: serine hydrolase domain-containing protein, partial [Actinomycetota bacterium]
LPGFSVADEGVSRTVTIRQCLAHTAGFDGDHFEDTGRGDDCLERYVASSAELEQISPPGKVWSYCNTAYSTLGRIVEVVTEKVWETALRERLLEPLGLDQTVLFPEEALLHGTAVGHVNDPANPAELIVTPHWGLFRSTGPMGASIIASAADVIAFARLHVDGGVAPGGERLLREETVAAMQEKQIDLVDPSLLGSGWGLGWVHAEWDGTRIIGHDGNSLGQNAFLRIAPDEGFAVCIQTNVSSVIGLARELFGWIFGERLGISPPPPLQAATEDLGLDPNRYTGTYRRIGLDQVVKARSDGGLVIDMIPHPDHPVAADSPPMLDLPLRPVDDRQFLVKLPIEEDEFPVVFFNPDDAGEVPTYLHFGARAARRA